VYTPSKWTLNEQRTQKLVFYLLYKSQNKFNCYVQRTSNLLKCLIFGAIKKPIININTNVRVRSFVRCICDFIQTFLLCKNVHIQTHTPTQIHIHSTSFSWFVHTHRCTYLWIQIHIHTYTHPLIHKYVHAHSFTDHTLYTRVRTYVYQHNNQSKLVFFFVFVFGNINW